MSHSAPVRAAALLLGLYALLTVSRPPELFETPLWPMRLAVSVLALLFGIGLWRGVRWAWWGALFLVLAMLSWLAIATAMMLGTPEGGSVLRGFAMMPAAVASTLAELGLLILLLLPATRYYFRRSAA